MQDVAFKPRAYQLAAESVAALGPEVQEAWKQGGIKALKDLPSIGQATAEKMDEYFRTGHVKEYEALKKQFPVDIWGLSRIEGLGPKNIFELWKTLHIKTVADLKKAIRAKKIRALPGFGEKSEEKLSRWLLLLEQSG